MLFLVNGRGARDEQVRVSLSKPRKRRRKRPAKGATHSGGTMARRRRSRAKTRASAPRRRSVRRRRRSVVRMHANPAARRVRRRRRHVAVVGAARRVRRFRRNPGLSPSGVVRTLKDGIVDGATVLAGEIVQNKAVALAGRFVPAMSGVAGIARTAALNLGVATVGSLAARKFAPSRSRMLSAGFFARAVANVLATTPAAALLGDGAVYELPLAAYPPAAFAAYPMESTANVPHAEH